MNRVLSMVLLLVCCGLVACANPHPPAKNRQQLMAQKASRKKQDIKGDVARKLLLTNLQQTVAKSDAVVRAAALHQGVASDALLRLEHLADERQQTFTYFKEFRGVTVANATKAIIDAQLVFQKALDYAQALRDQNGVKQAQDDYETAKQTLSVDVNLLNKALTNPRN